MLSVREILDECVARKRRVGVSAGDSKRFDVGSGSSSLLTILAEDAHSSETFGKRPRRDWSIWYVGEVSRSSSPLWSDMRGGLLFAT